MSWLNSPNILYLYASSNGKSGIAETYTPSSTDERPDEAREPRKNHGHDNNKDGVDMSNPGIAPKRGYNTNVSIDDEITENGKVVLQSDDNIHEKSFDD